MSQTPPRRGSKDGSMGKLLLWKCGDLSSDPQDLHKAGPDSVSVTSALLHTA